MFLTTVESISAEPTNLANGVARRNRGTKTEIAIKRKMLVDVVERVHRNLDFRRSTVKLVRVENRNRV